MASKTQRDDSNDAKISKPYRTAYSYDANKASRESGLTFSKPTKTQQHNKDETDINVIVQRFGVTGVLPQARNPPTYGDFTGINDYHQALDLIIQAQDSFNELPVTVRKHFDHDPGKFLAFIEAGPDAQLLLDFGLGHMVKPAKVASSDETKPKDPDPEPKPKA